MRKRKRVYFHLYRDNFSIATASHWCAWLSYCLSGMSNLDEVVSEANYWQFLTYKCIFIQVWTLSSYWVTNDCSKLRNTIRKVKEKICFVYVIPVGLKHYLGTFSTFLDRLQESEELRLVPISALTWRRALLRSVVCKESSYLHRAKAKGRQVYREK